MQVEFKLPIDLKTARKIFVLNRWF